MEFCKSGSDCRDQLCRVFKADQVRVAYLRLGGAPTWFQLDEGLITFLIAEVPIKRRMWNIAREYTLFLYLLSSREWLCVELVDETESKISVNLEEIVEICRSWFLVVQPSTSDACVAVLSDDSASARPCPLIAQGLAYDQFCEKWLP
ncbi:hypothetical protein Mapa_010358 [Marchantia paleacea]|nr:hypothetical protein Mapa_010358 [Marchantia paleacea]